jgi:hypothetical protein
MDVINSKCPCPNTGCEKHGKCVECILEHKGKGMYCKLPGWRRKINDLLCKVIPFIESLSESYAKK